MFREDRLSIFVETHRFSGRIFQCSGTSPSHSTPEGLRRTLGSRPRVTAWLMMACFSSSSSAMSFRLA